MNEPQDYAEDTEGEVLERVSRIRQWWELVMTIKKTIIFLLGFGAVSVAGNISGQNYWKETAIKIGIIDEVIHVQPSPEIEAEQPEYALKDHHHNYPEVIVGPPGKDGTDGKPGKDGADGKPGPQGKDGVDGKTIISNEALEQALEKVLPKDHRSLH